MKTRALLVATALAMTGGTAAQAARPSRTAAAPKKPIKSARKMARFLGKKSLFRKLSPTLTRGEFDSKFAVALEAPANLVRSYAGVFWRLARKAPPKRRLAKVGKVFGDAHRENFGFVKVGRRTIYGMTDYDDSGVGFVDDDAAHYFAELRLAEGKKSDLVDKAISQYAATVADPARAVDVDSDLAPDWDKTTKNDLARTVKGKRFRYGKNKSLRPARANERLEIERAMAANPKLAGLAVVDVAELIRTQGGSGGLARYWLLVEPSKGGDPYTIELKEIATPGVAESGVPQESDPATRLAGLKRAFWGTAAASDWFPLDVGGTPFLVRNRHSVEKVDLGRLKRADYEKVILAQASYMARVHRPAWSGASAADIQKDVGERTRDFAKAYRKAHKKLAD
jgi:uncharacterized protein (DUF2252 family)